MCEKTEIGMGQCDGASSISEYIAFIDATGSMDDGNLLDATEEADTMRRFD